MRSATPSTSPRATSGGAWSRARSYSAARSCRLSHSRSSKPRVVRSTTLAPRRSSNALVAIVVPCTSSSMAVALPPPPLPAVSIARNMPTDGSSGVVTTLRTSISPSSSTATRSVNVPPTSTPTLILPPPQCGMRNAECGVYRAEFEPRCRRPCTTRVRSIPHSAFRTPHSQARRFHACTPSMPANPKVAITASVPTQSPSRTRQVGKDRFVTDQHPEPAHRGRVERQPTPLTEAPEPVQVEPARRDEGHPLDDGHQVMLVEDRIGRPITRRIVKERCVVVVVQGGGIEAAGEEWRARLTPALCEHGIPIGAAHEVVGHRGLGPEQ